MFLIEGDVAEGDAVSAAERLRVLETPSGFGNIVEGFMKVKNCHYIGAQEFLFRGTVLQYVCNVGKFVSKFR